MAKTLLAVCMLVACAGALLVAQVPLGDTINLNFVNVATGVDDGPQDGSFDTLTGPNLGSVNNNGYGSFRTAFEFDLAPLQDSAPVASAHLTVRINNWEGNRSIELHGYRGNGVVELGDFSVDALLGAATVTPTGTSTLVFDVTGFVSDLLVSGADSAGFSLREAPANGSNFLIMFLDLNPAVTQLSITLHGTVVEPEAKPRPGAAGRGLVTSSVTEAEAFGYYSEKTTVVNTYDAPGNLLATTRSYDHYNDGSVDSSETVNSTYAPGGSVLTRAFAADFDGDGAGDALYTDTYTYGRRGEVLVFESVAAQGANEFWMKITTTYNARSRPLEEVFDIDFDNDGHIDSRSTQTYTYGVRDRLLFTITSGDDDRNGIPDWTDRMSYSYDARGRLVLTETSSDYDGNGVTDQVNRLLHAYDAAGNLVSTVFLSAPDAVSPASYRQVLTITYDARGNALQELVEHDYENDGMIDQRSTTTRTYDTHNKVLREVSETSDPGGLFGQSFTITNSYDRKGNLILIVGEHDFDLDGILDSRYVTTNHY